MSGVDRSAWDRNLATYRMREALFQADQAFGAFRHANVRWADVVDTEERRFGSVAKARLDPATNALLEAEWELMTAAEEAFGNQYDAPFDEAGIALALTPAPDLDAAIFKAAMIKERNFDEYADRPFDCMAVVLEDMARLSS